MPKTWRFASVHPPIEFSDEDHHPRRVCYQRGGNGRSRTLQTHCRDSGLPKTWHDRGDGDSRGHPAAACLATDSRRRPGVAAPSALRSSARHQGVDRISARRQSETSDIAQFVVERHRSGVSTCRLLNVGLAGAAVPRHGGTGCADARRRRAVLGRCRHRAEAGRPNGGGASSGQPARRRVPVAFDGPDGHHRNADVASTEHRHALPCRSP